MNFKNFIIPFLVISFLVSCKKKDSEPPTTTSQSTPQLPTYTGNISSGLFLTYNTGAFDTTFFFSGSFEKRIFNSSTFIRFDTVSIGAYSANPGNSYTGEVLSCPNFMQIASNCSFYAVSNVYGNFQYNDFRPIPKFAPTSNTMPITFDASQGLPININGIVNADYIQISDDCNSGCIVSGHLKTYYISGNSNIVDTIKDNMLYYIPLNTPTEISIYLGKSTDVMINGNKTYFEKGTKYIYSVKRIN